MSYSDRLKFLGLTTLELRRLRTDLIFCYKLLSGLISGPLDAYGIELSCRGNRGHAYKIQVQHSRINIRKNYFGCRVCSPWNSLDEATVTASSVSVFKHKLLDYDFKEFLSLNF